MKDLTAEWIQKAESDYRVAVRESNATDPAEPDAVCFHSQQCVEKYAKAFLQENDVSFARIHDMRYLHSLCIAVDQVFAGHRADFERLDDYSVDVRYPGESAVEEDARAALEIATRLRTFFRTKLGLDQPSTPEGA